MALNSSHDIFLQGDRICRISRMQKRVQQAIYCLCFAKVQKRTPIKFEISQDGKKNRFVKRLH